MIFIPVTAYSAISRPPPNKRWFWKLILLVIGLPEHERDEGHGDDKQVEQVEARSTEGAGVEDEAVADHLQADLNREDGRKEVVKVI